DDAELEPDEVLGGFQLLAEPAAHLGAGVAADERVNVVLLPELDEQLLPVAVDEPGVLLAPIEAEWHRTEQREGRILADEVISGGVAGLHGADSHRAHRLLPQVAFARREGLAMDRDVPRPDNEISPIL